MPSILELIVGTIIIWFGFYLLLFLLTLAVVVTLRDVRALRARGYEVVLEVESNDPDMLGMLEGAVRKE